MLVSAPALVSAASDPPGTTAVAAAAAAGPALTLGSETPWLTPDAPWFDLSFGVGEAAVPIDDLHVELTFYGRIDDASQLEQDLSSVPPGRDELMHVSVPVTASAAGRTAATCVTVLRDASETPPPTTGAAGTCSAGAADLVLGCTPEAGVCGDVYPVSAALVRSGAGTDTTVSRFTTFFAYEEPDRIGSGGPLQVSLVVPLGTGTGWSPPATPRAPDRLRAERLVSELASAHGMTLTLAVSPLMAEDLFSVGGRAGRTALSTLAGLGSAPVNDEVLAQPYVPVNLAALAGAGLDDEIRTQMQRGTALLRAAGLHPSATTWVDTNSTFTTANAANLADGLDAAGATQVVVDDSDLSPAGSDQLTFAQPFTLTLAKGDHVTAAAADSAADARFDADPGDPVLEAEQLVAMLEFIHFENAFTIDARGIALTPPPGWNPNPSFVTALAGGLVANPALSTVTLDSLLSQVPVGGNDEPSSRDLHGGSPPRDQLLSTAAAARISSRRSQLGSFTAAVAGHPASLGTFSDELLTTESSTLNPAQRTTAISEYDARFGRLLGQVTLAPERTITFTSRTAPIPITVESSAPYTLNVVLSLDSDKFTFPNGSTRALTLDHPTTPVRLAAEARTSGDKLPVTVTLRTPDGLLVIARTVVTVRSTSISVVGIALTVLAGLTLLIWWGRTWRRERQQRPRAH